MSGGARIAGVELGGTKSIAVLAQGRHSIERYLTPTTLPDETLGLLRRQLDAWNRVEPLASVGIASFGPLQLDRASPGFGHMLQTPKPGWSGADIAGGIMASLDCPWRIDTDVNGAALAEYHWGAGKGADNPCYITVGTGLGGGILVGGQPLHGVMHPEIGHIRVRRVPGDNFPGVCPMHGDCIEGLVCGPALERRFGRSAQQVPDDDPLWELVAADLSELVTTLLLTISPSHILFGGGVSMARPFLLPLIRRKAVDRLASYLPFFDQRSADAIIRPPLLGEDAGPLGAVALGMMAVSLI